MTREEVIVFIKDFQSRLPQLTKDFQTVLKIFEEYEKTYEGTVVDELHSAFQDSSFRELIESESVVLNEVIEYFEDDDNFKEDEDDDDEEEDD